jgi:hypothetical protein
MGALFPEQTSTLIIGGGPSGLVSLKYATEYGPTWATGEEPVLVEMEPRDRWNVSVRYEALSLLLLSPSC